jgi:carboxylate-amine ligase
VEEEFLVVDPVTRRVTPAAGAVVDQARPVLGGRVGGEITTLQVETRTDPCTTLDDLHDQLRGARTALAAAAAAAGLRVMASGTPVLGDAVPPPLTVGARQDQGTATFRGLHDELAICALHVHVELPDRDEAALVSNHLRPHLPVLIALAANSPFWAERDTGYASWRTVIWQRWPVAGPPPYLTSAAHYDEVVATLRDAGALVDAGTIFWDIRLSAHAPTLELRVTDVPPTAEESALVAALVRGLVAAVLPAVRRGDPGPVLPAELLRLAYWRAARDGLAGQVADPATGALVPASVAVERLVRLARPGLDRHGDVARVSGWLRTTLAGGDGAGRQRRVAAGGRLTDVVDHLVAATAG